MLLPSLDLFGRGTEHLRLLPREMPIFCFCFFIITLYFVASSGFFFSFGGLSVDMAFEGFMTSCIPHGTIHTGYNIERG